ncbi:DEAD/DEAH box helicase family protein [Corynebacterium lizhenjunii]|uniref:DEAD/DEAH box helicase family protein n=1 Tax=Corynebacterium lizhenjunii TaxID=2709394 RepID=A0A7T0KGP5_9CORY|nr:DEAD/DEAH box helicase family protein [Corynebacterium lizhenjunii]QPK79824.1 DEAD/DEAH box helicase family protein [Corynebacterium lizhenjunii]
MANRLNLSFNSDMLESISSEFDLRTPNKEALHKLVSTLAGDYDPAVMQVLNLATGVGKTYLMAAFVEYLRRQGVSNVVIVTPGKTVQTKTMQNFRPGSPRYITGSSAPPEVVTPQDYSAWVSRQNGAPQLSFGHEVPLLAFIFNIQQLIAPKKSEGSTHGSTQDAVRRRPRRFDENAGVLFDYLKDLEDLVVIADESHLYSSTAKEFNAALKELAPAATIGLTASVNRKSDHVIYHYPLFRAIQDKYVKAPVLAFRKTGYGDDEAAEELQLRDALQLRDFKQSYYDAYAANNNCDKVNAVVFVVCSDVEHATQVAELLRTPEYLGRAEAVLQVDSKHEDELTQRLLNELDRPHSPVRAVVSVNKLKEGWDVKNIAVIVTLRAMASEVLTQQTMGRGLRLPFGHYTGVQQIDQLDIIAHQSFNELLAAENVLQQFGLEEAIDSESKARVSKAIRRAASEPDAEEANSIKQENGNQPALNSSKEPKPAGGSNPAGNLPDAIPVHESSDEDKPGVSIRTITSPVPDSAQEAIPGLITIERNPAFAEVTYHFPVTTISVQQPPIDLSEISEASTERAARRVTSAGDVLLRKEIIAALGKPLRLGDRESAEVDSISVDHKEAANALVKLVMNMALVPKTEQTARYVEKFLVPRFMQLVTFEDWTIKSLDSARRELQNLVETHTKETLRATREVPTIHPKVMPGSGYTLPFGKEIHDQIESRDHFRRGQFYRGWIKSLFPEESFDSFSGEYQLARLLDTSPRIMWWHRLHAQDQAFVYYNAKDRYFPDFVALDTEGVHWIIEGKSERGRDDAQVQAKREAAESLVRRLIAEDNYEGQHWGYLIAYEQDIARADSWEDLKALSQAVSNLL